MYGFEADKHLFRCLVSSVDFVSEGRNSSKDGQQLQLLIQEANLVVTKPNFVSILCYAFEKQDYRVSFLVCLTSWTMNLSVHKLWKGGGGHFWFMHKQGGCVAGLGDHNTNEWDSQSMLIAYPLGFTAFNSTLEPDCKNFEVGKSPRGRLVRQW